MLQCTQNLGCRVFFLLQPPAERFFMSIINTPVQPFKVQAYKQGKFIEVTEQSLKGRWSAFVAPDLAAVFDEEPGLDLPPNPAGQADLLSRLASTPLTDFQRALARLQPVAAAATAATAAGAAPAPAAPGLTPRDFLLAVMNDTAVDLALRVEAAKALLAPRPPA